MNDRIIVTVQPVTVTRATAARMLDISLASFERHVQPHLKLIRKDKLRLVAVAELERWANESAEGVIPDDGTR